MMGCCLLGGSTKAKADGSTFIASPKMPLWHSNACGCHCGTPMRSPQEFLLARQHEKTRNSMHLHFPCVITPALPGQDTDELCLSGAHCQASMKVLQK